MSKPIDDRDEALKEKEKDLNFLTCPIRKKPYYLIKDGVYYFYPLLVAQQILYTAWEIIPWMRSPYY